MRRREVAGASVDRAVRVVVVVVSASISAFAFVFLPRDAFTPAVVHLTGAVGLAKALAGRAMGIYAPLEPPFLREGGRAGEGRTTSSCHGGD